MYKKNLKPNLNTEKISKELLLNTGYFVNNNFLEKYLSIFEEPLNNSDKLEGHRICPRAYYFTTKQKVNNLKENLRTITYKNHYLAHYYLCHCTKGEVRTRLNRQFSLINRKLVFLAFELMSQVYETVRVNDKDNYIAYIKTAHNNINEYNKKFPKRPKSHVDKIQQSLKIRRENLKNNDG